MSKNNEAKSSQKKKKKEIEKIKFVGLPKGSVMWPTAVVSIILGIIALFFPEIKDPSSLIFLTVFTLNLLILFFDFSRGAVVGILGLLIALVSLAYAFNWSIPFKDIIGRGVIGGASAEFFIMYGLVFLLLLLFAVLFRRKFEYFQVSSNELIRKFGILGDSERFNAPDIHIKKVINDVFESILLFGAGDMVITTSKGAEFHLNNVPHINRLEKDITHLLSRLEVDVNRNGDI